MTDRCSNPCYHLQGNLLLLVETLSRTVIHLAAIEPDVVNDDGKDGVGVLAGEVHRLRLQMFQKISQIKACQYLPLHRRLCKGTVPL